MTSSSNNYKPGDIVWHVKQNGPILLLKYVRYEDIDSTDVWRVYNFNSKIQSERYQMFFLPLEEVAR